MKYDCLIVDDEEALADSTCEYFNMFDVKTAVVYTKSQCMEFFGENQAEMILLDISLGNDSGFALCKELREKIQVPILFISARTSDDDVLIALNIGGDDYIKKPYSLSILLAKVKAVLRRQKLSNVRDLFEDRGLVVDFKTSRASLDGTLLKLKTMEYQLLEYLVQNANRIIPKEELFRKVWKDAITGDGTLNVHIRRIREKIEENPNDPKRIKTIWGTGYVYEEEYRD
ncbi:response regulator transcription factor [Robinsoniella peoriensis]|uniref:Stage 0 sporulation protein A homolog n=2 Tax=Robinsoniella peoriensis TaxID=180332 RepID=A0A4U8Q6N3_9FIRM|nr:response regulator transcription factor [Robinsoniella peoriensis]TLD00511.1 Sensory transduction protein regX3 [Robinsoniella peoriensis]